jgi:septal ring factor EnvC (AmiA/AmiB activator)
MAEEKVINLKVNDNIENATSKTKNLRQQLREATQEVQRLSEEFGETSKQTVAAAKRAAELRDRIEDAADTIQAFKGEGAFLATTKAVGAVSSGLSAATGAMGLFGSESKEVEQAILRVQGAMALSQGLAGLEDAGRAFKTMGIAAKNALAGIRTGIAATGFGVLLVALGAVVAYWDEINAAISDNTDTLDEYAEAQTKVTEGVKEFNQSVISVKNSFDAARAGTMSKEAALKQYNDTLGKSVGYAGSLEQAESLMAANTAIVVNGIKLRAQAQVFYAKSAEAAAKAVSGEGVDPTFFDEAVNYVKALGNTAIAASLNVKTVASNLQGLRKQQDVFGKEGDKLTEQALENDKKLKKGLAEPPKPPKTAEQLAAEKKAAEEKAKAAAEKAKQERYKQIEDEAKRRAEENQAFLDEQKSANEQLNALKDANIARDANDLLVRGQMASTDIAIAGNTYKAKKEFSDKEIADIEAVTQARIISAQAIGNAMGVLSDIIGRETAAGKAMGVAQALINTYIGASEAIKQKSTLPSPFDVITKVANVATILATGFSTVRQLTRVQVPGRGGSGGGASMGGVSSGMVASAAPQFNVVGTSGALASQVQAATTPQAPIKAFVVGNDVTTQQALDRNIVKSATLG